MTEPPLDDHEPDDATRVGDADDTSTFDAFDIGEDTGMSVARPTGRLVCLVGREPGRVYPLGPRPVVIGRGADAQIQLEGHDVSRAHARVSWLVDHFVLEDLGSRNGVSVNGVPVRTHRLQLGDRIQIGGAAILVLAENDDLERRALRLQRLEALGELASGVVHDFKNTLSVILGITGARKIPVGMPASASIFIARSRWRGGAVPGSITRQTSSSSVVMVKQTRAPARSSRRASSSISRITSGDLVTMCAGVA